MYQQHTDRYIYIKFEQFKTPPHAIRLPGAGVTGVSVVITGGKGIFLPAIIRIWCVLMI